MECEDCKGNGRDKRSSPCETCGGKGWLTPFEYAERVGLDTSYWDDLKCLLVY